MSMMRLSCVATLKVSCMKTPLITASTEKPMSNLCITKKMSHHSLKFSTSALQGGIQLPKVISNMVSRDLPKLP